VSAAGPDCARVGCKKRRVIPRRPSSEGAPGKIQRSELRVVERRGSNLRTKKTLERATTKRQSAPSLPFLQFWRLIRGLARERLQAAFRRGPGRNHKQEINGGTGEKRLDSIILCNARYAKK
jgi:hypothetical protein